MIKNAYIEDSILVGRPIGGGTDEMTQEKTTFWGVNAHLRIDAEEWGG
jgi:hypothetical protein